MSSVSRYTELAFWSAIPALVTLIFILLQIVPKHIPGFSTIMPLLYMGAIYYWGIHRSREMPYWFLGIAGLFNDSIVGLPLGISPLLFVLFLIILQSQIKHIYKEGFLIKWGFFSGLSLVILALQWLMMAVLSSSAYPLLTPFIQWITTMGCYPLVHLLCNKITETAAARRWHLQHVK